MDWPGKDLELQGREVNFSFDTVVSRTMISAKEILSSTFPEENNLHGPTWAGCIDQQRLLNYPLPGGCKEGAALHRE